mgnify:CR=1 FL=1
MRFDDEYKNAVESDKLSDDFIKELSIKNTGKQQVTFPYFLQSFQ